MGCWNATCGLSNLPIHSGEKVRLYFLERNKYVKELPSGGGFCYPHDFYSPVGLPVVGEYDDYGGIDKVKKNYKSKAILDYFNGRIKKGLVITDDCDKVVKKFTTVKKLTATIQPGGSEFVLFMVLESIYQATLKAQENFDSKCEYSVARWKETTKEITDMVAKSKKKALAATTEKLLNKEKGDFYYMMSFMDVERLFRNTLNSIYLTDYLLKLSVETQDLIDHYTLSCSMHGLRRAWMPQSGAGSQDDSYGLHRMMAEAKIAHIEAKKLEALRNDSDDPDTVARILKAY